MNRYWTIFIVASITAVALIVFTMRHYNKNGDQKQGGPGTEVKVTAPAREIPTDVSANMQAALAARQQKLQQMAKGSQ